MHVVERHVRETEMLRHTLVEQHAALEAAAAAADARGDGDAAVATRAIARLRETLAPAPNRVAAAAAAAAASAGGKATGCGATASEHREQARGGVDVRRDANSDEAIHRRWAAAAQSLGAPKAALVTRRLAHFDVDEFKKHDADRSGAIAKWEFGTLWRGPLKVKRSALADADIAKVLCMTCPR
jgi:hypothetical protein